MTRQQIFLEQYPDAYVDRSGILEIDPCNIDKNYGHYSSVCNQECSDCKKEYWLGEPKRGEYKITLKDYVKFCNSHKSCDECEFFELRNDFEIEECGRMICNDNKEAYNIVFDWLNTHGTTRQEEFLKLYPTVEMDSNNIINILPCVLTPELEEQCDNNCKNCKINYWTERIADK